MALILNIDTSLDTASVSVAVDGNIIGSDAIETQKDHATWIQGAISRIISDTGFEIGRLNGVGVCIGPGSYTGLRIGLATAKGICYSLKIPLLTEVSLKIMAYSAVLETISSNFQPKPDNLLFCPMIDARRMEVFTAIYDQNLEEIEAPRALIINENSFNQYLKRQKILFLGNGSLKFQSICQNEGAIFKKIPLNPLALATLTYRNFIGNDFADLAYTEPLYLKDFYTNKQS